MERSDIVIATISWARNESEEKLLREALTELAKLSFQVFITDGGSSTEFLQFIKSLPHFTLLKPDEKGLWAQAKKSLQAAQNTKSQFILYSEPDKLSFFKEFLSNFISDSPSHEKLGIVLASRTTTGFTSFPDFQQKTETAINECCAEILKQKIDYTYGPFILNKNLVPYLTQVKEDIGWGWRPLTFGLAHRLGCQINYQAKDFTCPLDQQEDTKTERIYRMKQLTQNIQGLLLSTTVPILS
ncbi:hypothetical protein [Adhaeribacter aquaticus]|uniref:hypothetical protein n=1 Tax=Adhaeribacter aquaticus TaxID=299567 RepID=UPI0004099AAF|nr:hypothetical protein [Adhaeribacter aquaticus]